MKYEIRRINVTNIRIPKTLKDDVKRFDKDRNITATEALRSIIAAGIEIETSGTRQRCTDTTILIRTNKRITIQV